MVVPKIGTQYILRKVADEVMAKPVTPEQAEASLQAAPTVQATIEHDLNGRMITDEEGIPVGLARRLKGAAVYVIGAEGTDPHQLFRDCLEDEEARVLFQWVDDELVGIVYVPDANRIPPPPDVMRADDI